MRHERREHRPFKDIFKFVRVKMIFDDRTEVWQGNKLISRVYEKNGPLVVKPEAILRVE